MPGGLIALGIAFMVQTIPSDIATDLTLQILTALFTSGTVFLPLAGIVLTFALNSTNTRMESLRRDRLAVWVAQQEAYVKAAIENKPEISRRIGDRFGPTLKGYDAQIASLEEDLKPLGGFCAAIFCTVLAEILVSLRAMAEVRPQQPFPYAWVSISVSLLVLALYGLAVLVYWTAQVGRSTESR